MLLTQPYIYIYIYVNVNYYSMMPFKNDLLWSPINKMTENNTEVTSKTREVGFIGSTPYKVNKKFDKKQNKLMKKCFLMGTIHIYPICILPLLADASLSLDFLKYLEGMIPS